MTIQKSGTEIELCMSKTKPNCCSSDHEGRTTSKVEFSPDFPMPLEDRAVWTREEIDELLAQHRISLEVAQEMLYLTYDLKSSELYHARPRRDNRFTDLAIEITRYLKFRRSSRT
jgi:hypothetical protein